MTAWAKLLGNLENRELWWCLCKIVGLYMAHLKRDAGTCNPHKRARKGCSLPIFCSTLGKFTWESPKEASYELMWLQGSMQRSRDTEHLCPFLAQIAGHRHVFFSATSAAA